MNDERWINKRKGEAEKNWTELKWDSNRSACRALVSRETDSNHCTCKCDFSHAIDLQWMVRIKRANRAHQPALHVQWDPFGCQLFSIAFDCFLFLLFNSSVLWIFVLHISFFLLRGIAISTSQPADHPTDLSNFQFKLKPYYFHDKIIFEWEPIAVYVYITL